MPMAALSKVNPFGVCTRAEFQCAARKIASACSWNVREATCAARLFGGDGGLIPAITDRAAI